MVHKAASGKKKNHQPKQTRRQGGERRLIVLASLVIVVAAISIGAMLALQYRTAAPEVQQAGSSTRSSLAPAHIPAEPAPERRSLSANEHHYADELPIYEETVEPAAPTPAIGSPVVRRPLPSTSSAMRVSPRISTNRDSEPAWQRNAVAVASVGASGNPDTRPAIAIVIDDLGFDRDRGARILDLPSPLTLAFLPYAHDLENQTGAARRAGHELLVHVPMDPSNREITDPGPNALLIDLDAEEMRRRVDWNLSQFHGFVGINNHMGSRFTAQPGAIDELMRSLKQRGLLFLDSRTSGKSVAVSAAHRFDVPAVARDVFIDHIRTTEAVLAALAEVERVARRKGYAIAIGHPRDVTIDALTEWLPNLEERGFRLVPVSALVREMYAGG